ncbi:MAG: hypothetical protein GY941_23665 [Planctomycetes bacterium]|nr:hypothetical protein [Planctomycetota bacterium]
MSKKELITQFDKFLKSNVSRFLNWLWKSGLMAIIIALIAQNLIEQREIRNEFTSAINAQKTKILILTESNNRVVELSEKNEQDILELREKSSSNTFEINFIKRRLDGLNRLDRSNIIPPF